MEDNDPWYDIFAKHDDKAERYGQPCSRCGTLTWGGDCPNCDHDMDEPPPAAYCDHRWEEQPGEPAHDVCYHCGGVRY